MPQYERWTRSELENESERLGYDDGFELPTYALIARAQTAWTNQMGCRPHGLGIFTGKTPSANDESSVDHHQDDSGSASLNHQLRNEDEDYNVDPVDDEQEYPNQFDPYQYSQEDDDIAWENNLLNPEDHNLFIQSDSASEPGPLRPFFESFTKPKLELEYAKLARQIESIEASADDALAEVRLDLDKVPKTKTALTKKVLRLWDALHPDIPTVHSLNPSGTASQPKSSVKILKEKIDLAGLNRVMLLLLNSHEPELYLRILRFEPIQFSVLEDKVKKLLEQEFEERFKVQLALQQSQSQRTAEGEVEGQEHDLTSSSSSDDGDDDNAEENDDQGTKDRQSSKQKTKKCQKRKVKKTAGAIVSVTKQVLHVDTLTRWLDFQAVSYFLLDPAAPRKPRY